MTKERLCEEDWTTHLGAYTFYRFKLRIWVKNKFIQEKTNEFIQEKTL